MLLAYLLKLGLHALSAHCFEGDERYLNEATYPTFWIPLSKNGYQIFYRDRLQYWLVAHTAFICYPRSRAKSGVLIVVLVGTNRHILVNRSTTTQMASCPWLVSGNPTIKSIEILSHLPLGISNGCKILPAFRLLALLTWHFWQCVT